MLQTFQGHRLYLCFSVLGMRTRFWSLILTLLVNDKPSDEGIILVKNHLEIVIDIKIYASYWSTVVYKCVYESVIVLFSVMWLILCIILYSTVATFASLLYLTRKMINISRIIVVRLRNTVCSILCILWWHATNHLIWQDVSKEPKKIIYNNSWMALSSAKCEKRFNQIQFFLCFFAPDCNSTETNCEISNKNKVRLPVVSADINRSSNMNSHFICIGIFYVPLSYFRQSRRKNGYVGLD